MINQDSISAVNASTFSEKFRMPLYDSYCFSNITPTIEKLLCGDTKSQALPATTLQGLSSQYDQVVLFFVDAFGWRFFEQYKNRYPTLRRFVEEGVVSKITSQFPSTTAAHVTAIHTGKRVDESGVFEWFYFEPKVDDIIAPLLFSYARDKGRNTLASSSIEPKELYPNDSFYAQLEKQSITTHIFQSSVFTPSTYGDVVTAGLTNLHPYDTLASGLQELQKEVMSSTEKSYYYFYYGHIDNVGHIEGPSSAAFEAEVDFFFTQLETLFVSKVIGNCGKTLMLMTADHGQTEISPDKTIYLNKEIPEITSWLKTNTKGVPLVFGGSCRDLFLYIKDEYLDSAFAKIKELVIGKAEVYLVEDLITLGLFGDKVSQTLRDRIGNICILPYKHDAVYWYEEGVFEQDFFGHHGGLTPEEMESIFLALPL